MFSTLDISESGENKMKPKEKIFPAMYDQAKNIHFKYNKYKLLKQKLAKRPLNF